jgi:hypothetical protein
LSSFGASNLSGATSDEDGTNKLTEAFKRISRFKLFAKKLILKSFAFIKDRSIECFRKSLSLERGKSVDIIMFRGAIVSKNKAHFLEKFLLMYFSFLSLLHIAAD